MQGISAHKMRAEPQRYREYNKKRQRKTCLWNYHELRVLVDEICDPLFDQRNNENKKKLTHVMYSVQCLYSTTSNRRTNIFTLPETKPNEGKSEKKNEKR